VGFWDFFWLMVWGFFFIAYLMVLLQVIVDVFRDRSLNGWARTSWLIALFVAPPVTALVYILIRGRSMGERSREAGDGLFVSDAQLAASADPADTISRGKALLDSGTISASEFDRLKGKALA
jgi:hypothetical protein